MNRNDYIIRLERKEEYRDVENLVREAFWNVYRPGAYEHYVIHVLRDDPAFVKELDFVMEQNGRLIGQNMFMKTDYASRFGIRYHDLPEGADASFFLGKELIPGYLDGITGVYQTPAGYYVDEAEVEAFDQSFPHKEKLKLPGQLF